MRTPLLLAAALLTSLTVQGEDAGPNRGTLEIRVTNVENASGTIYVAVQDAAENWLDSDPAIKPFRDAKQQVSSTDDVLISLADLPPGKYAVSVFHDLDGDAELATNFIGFPKEPFGFSAPMGKFGPPKFEEAAVDFSGEDTSVDVKLNQ